MIRSLFFAFTGSKYTEPGNLYLYTGCSGTCRAVSEVRVERTP